MAGKRQHFVTKSFINGFADKEHVAYFDKRTRTIKKSIHTTNVFVEQHHSSSVDMAGRRDSTLDKRFTEIEDDCIRHIRSCKVGCDRSREQIDAILRFTALHVARSKSLEHSPIQDEIQRVNRTSVVQQIEEDEAISNLFLADMGRLPRPGELAEAVDRIEEREKSSKRARVRTLENIFDRAVELFTGFHIQLAAPMTSPGFALGDSPVVHSRGSTVGLLDGLAVGDANLVFIPLGKSLLASFSKEPLPDIPDLPYSHVAQINRLVFENAFRFVIAHPSGNLKRMPPPGERWSINSGTDRRGLLN